MPREIRQIKDALHREFDELIDMSDSTTKSPEELERKFLSRALACLVARKLTGWDRYAAAETLIDGRDELGIDAVVVDEESARVWLIQSKWSDRGTAGFGIAEALKLIEGLDHIDDHNFSHFNRAFQENAVERIKSVWRDFRLRVTLVVALTGSDELHPDVERRFLNAKKRYNRNDPVLNFETWGTGKVWKIVRDDFAEPAVNLTVKLDKSMHMEDPFEAYQGRVSVAEVAQWLEDNGDRLFAQNIRKSLGLTEVNHKMVETLLHDPTDFWYFNNGITILCESLRRETWSKASQGPIELHLSAASVVNGAQTVVSIAEAMQRDPAATEAGHVGVRIITTQDCPEGFGDRVTRTTNTQNRVEKRDFVSLHSEQLAIRQDFAIDLGRIYTIKRGEPDPAPEAGCSVVHAAIALACAHRNPELAIRAKQNIDLLWEEGEKEAYNLLFRDSRPSAYQIWRSVLVLRMVGAALQEGQKEREGRAQAVGEYGDYLITHIVFQQLDDNSIDDPDHPWESKELERVPSLTYEVLAWLVHHCDESFGTGSSVRGTFLDMERSAQLAALVTTSLRDGSTGPALRPEYRRSKPNPRMRRPNAVPTLVDAQRIPPGTILAFTAPSRTEREALADWIADDPRRAQAAWINDRSAPLLWSADGRQYSPSGLVSTMWKEANWETAPVSVQGPRRWVVPGEGTLWELALDVLAERSDQHGSKKKWTARHLEAALVKAPETVRAIFAALLAHAERSQARIVSNSASYPSISAHYPVAGTPRPMFTIGVEGVDKANLYFSLGALSRYVSHERVSRFATALEALPPLRPQLKAARAKNFNAWPGLFLMDLADVPNAQEIIFAAIEEVLTS
ncbi:AIPR family protein [Nonomuraea insulae]|uniref:AIPR family protein n=1 Tax=Nonomuraea insulae TaxID=1616787 RepID=A0ABW1CW62_9ACTN